MAQKLRTFLTFLLSLALVFSLVSCDDESSDDDSSNNTTQEDPLVNEDGSWKSRIINIVVKDQNGNKIEGDGYNFTMMIMETFKSIVETASEVGDDIEEIINFSFNENSFVTKVDIKETEYDDSGNVEDVSTENISFTYNSDFTFSKGESSGCIVTCTYDSDGLFTQKKETEDDDPIDDYYLPERNSDKTIFRIYGII
jgi:hypothetical protein